MDYLDFAVDLSRKSGEVIHKNFKLGMEKKWKADKTPVTETDLEINSLIINEVNKQFPDHDILGEEESDMSNHSKYVWVCDPIDGTTPFSSGVPTFMFSIALVENGEPILGVTYDAILDRMYTSQKGSGAFLNGKKINVSLDDSIAKSMISSSYWKDAKYQLGKVDDYLVQNDVKTVNFRSHIYSSMMVAAGQFSAVIFPGLTAHDGAAVKIIVEESGGKVTDIEGNEQRYDIPINGQLVSNGKIHDQLLEILRENMIIK